MPYPCCSFITVGLWRFTWILRLVGALNHRGSGNQAVDCDWERARDRVGVRGLDDRWLDEKSIRHESLSAQIIYLPLLVSLSLSSDTLHLHCQLKSSLFQPCHTETVSWSCVWHLCVNRQIPTAWIPIKSDGKDSFKSEIMGCTQAQKKRGYMVCKCDSCEATWGLDSVIPDHINQ